MTFLRRKDVSRSDSTAVSSSTTSTRGLWCGQRPTSKTISLAFFYFFFVFYLIEQDTLLTEEFEVVK
jgi:hypothetical protein